MLYSYIFKVSKVDKVINAIIYLIQNKEEEWIF